MENIQKLFIWNDEDRRVETQFQKVHMQMCISEYETMEILWTMISNVAQIFFNLKRITENK